MSCLSTAAATFTFNFDGFFCVTLDRIYYHWYYYITSQTMEQIPTSGMQCMCVCVCASRVNGNTVAASPTNLRLYLFTCECDCCRFVSVHSWKHGNYASVVAERQPDPLPQSSEQFVGLLAERLCSPCLQKRGDLGARSCSLRQRNVTPV